MTELPRSRALVRLDGPGHIMPVEPTTPPGSTIWRIVHFPLVLAVVALGLLVLAGIATNVVGVGFRAAGHVPGARFLTPIISTAAVAGAYWLFVRVVERRRDMAELGTAGWLREAGLGFAGGLVLNAGIFAIVYLSGALHVFGFNAPSVLAQPLVSSICAAIVQEMILRGLLFRQAERLLGSWLAVVLTAVVFGVAAVVTSDAGLRANLAIVLEAGLLFTALYMATRRLWAAIGLHAAWNFAQVALYGIAATPGGPRSFVLTLMSGPDWLTGGSAGADASVPALLANAALVVALLVVAMRRGFIVRPAWRRGRSA